jgi:hypothetical protein
VLSDLAAQEAQLLSVDFTPPVPPPSPVSAHRFQRKQRLQHRIFRLNYYNLSNLSTQTQLRKHTDILFFRTITPKSTATLFSMTLEHNHSLIHARNMCIRNLSTLHYDILDNLHLDIKRQCFAVASITALSSALELKEFLSCIPDSTSPVTSLFHYVSSNIHTISNGSNMFSTEKHKPPMPYTVNHIRIHHLGLLGYSKTTWLYDNCGQQNCLLHALHFVASLPASRQFEMIHNHISSLITIVIKYEMFTLIKPELLTEASLTHHLTTSTLAHLQTIMNEIYVQRSSDSHRRRLLVNSHSLPVWLFFLPQTLSSRL